ncbi:MFS transporter [Streptomyces sp. NPDC090106]|uniref:MFS transporter n=1 Tax=Streptomyces sp. NPDC090106 TaxID=3365946 RepID=UPI0037FE3BA2
MSLPSGTAARQHRGARSATAIPTWRTLGVLFPTTAAMYAVYQGIQQVLLPAQVEQIDAANKISNLAWLTLVSSITAAVALPVGGALSDRTRSRWGRRAPWLVATAAISAVLLALMGSANGIVLLGLVYAALWFFMNYYQAVLTAVMPDRFPEDKRGTASSVIGIGLPVGIVVGVNLVAHTARVQGYLLLALLLVVCTALFVTVARDRSSLRPMPDVEDAPPAAPDPAAATMSRGARRRRAVADFFAGFRSRDFTLAFTGRALLFLAFFTVSGYTYYLLQDRIGVENLPGGSTAVAVSIISTVTNVAMVLSVLTAGWISDRIGRRKPFVIACSIGLGLSMLVPVVLTSWTGMLVYSALTGLFFGTYMTVDLALMSLVLPSSEDAGRDMGVLAVATSGPQILSSFIGAGIITLLGGYTGLFVFGAVLAVLGGLVMIPIKSVR